MHTRTVGTPLRASRSACLLALLLAGAILPAAPTLAGNFWYLAVPPDSLVRWSPRSPAEAAQLAHRPAPGSARSEQAAPASPEPQPAIESGEWRPMAAMGPQYFHDSVIDPVARRLVLFGGVGDPIHGAPAPDLARAAPLDGGAWEPLGLDSAVRPARRWNMSVALDPVHHALLVFGGQALDGTGDPLGDLWSLSLEPNGTWTRLSPSGPAPSPRRFASLFHDAPRNRFLLAGGFDNVVGLPEIWELRLDPAPAWRRLVLDGPPDLWLGPVFADPATGDAWWVAWQNEIHPLAIGDDTVGVEAPFAIEPDPSRWVAGDLQLTGFDPVGRRLLWFECAPYSTVVSLDRPRWFSLDAPHTFVAVDVASASPAKRYLFASNWDGEARRLVLTGGYDDDETYFGDAWQLWMSAPLPTPVAASLWSADSDVRGVRLTWFVPAGPGGSPAVQQSLDGVEWTDVGEAYRTAGDEWSWNGPPLAPSARAAFRLVLSSGGAETRTPAVWLRGPAAGRLALAPRAGPAGPELAVTLVLALVAPARLRVFDAAGRLVAEACPPAGATAWNFGRAPAPGLYLAELTQGAERRVTRLVSLR
jgi:hypothetical protein